MSRIKDSTVVKLKSLSKWIYNLRSDGFPKAISIEIENGQKLLHSMSSKNASAINQSMTDTLNSQSDINTCLDN